MAMVRRLIDYRCNMIKGFYDGCVVQGQDGSGYAQAHNELVELRETVNEINLKNIQDWDGPMAEAKIDCPELYNKQ